MKKRTAKKILEAEGAVVFVPKLDANGKPIHQGASSFVHKVEVRDREGVPDGSVGHVDDRRNLSDAVMLIIRLSRALEREHPVRVQAMDWIERKGLTPSVLR